MTTLQYGNNLTQLKERTNQLSNSRKTSKNWLIISPPQVVLQGMLLTGNFNIQNTHEHLSMNFKIKPYLQGQEAQFIEVFPEKGSIMRDEIKKFRVKLARDFKPEFKDNGSMMIKVFVNLDTEWNKQYMITNRLRGWEEIKDLPIEEYQIPILISDEYQDIKQNIRNSVLFESEFGKVSQDLSSLYGDEKFQIPEMDNPSKNNLVWSKQKPRYSQHEPFYEKKRMSTSEKKGSRSSIYVDSPKREVYFGHGPKMVQSRLEMDQSLRKSRAGSVRKQYQSRNSGVLQLNTPVRDKESFEIPQIKKSLGMNNPFNNHNNNNEANLLRNFNSDQRIPTRQNAARNFEKEDSSISILKSLEPQGSHVSEYKYREERSNYQSMSRNQEQSVFKEYKTVDNDFPTPGTPTYYANKRSMELIVLAIIAGFFVALGSNVGRLFS